MPGLDDYRVPPDKKLDLGDYKSDDDGGREKDPTQAETERLHERLIELSQRLYADGRYALLVVFQGMDTSGKDSTTRAVFGGISPTGIDATSFKAPSSTELRHDFLWRIHQHAPARGEIAIFNRSHYEDVLIARVRELVPRHVWQRRYEHINAFEKLLADEGAAIVKFFLHISKDYQRERLQRRLDDPDKHWKFNPADLAERSRWQAYQEAYAEALARCSTPWAPWYIVPAEKRWFRDWLVTRVLVATLEKLELRYPKAAFDPAAIRIE